MATTLNLQLNQGWSWISLNVEASDMSVNGVFESLGLRNGDHVKSQFLFTDYYEGFGFFGQLRTMHTDEMYSVKLSAATTLTITGTPTALPKPIALGTGW